MSILPRCALLLALAASALAQGLPVDPVIVVPEPTPLPLAPVRAGITTLLLGSDVSNGIVRSAPGSRVRVPPYEEVRLLVPEGWSHPIQWTRDEKPIPGATGRSLVIPLATSADTGRYNIVGAPFPIVATGISLEVVGAGNVANFSARLELAPKQTQVIGFVATGRGKSLLLRAVGPTLKSFGVAQPAAQPRMKFFDAAGREFGWGRVAVGIDYEALFRSVGAFSLAGEAPGGSSYDYGPFPAGAYTVVVSDASGQGGTVLLEAYELP